MNTFKNLQIQLGNQIRQYRTQLGLSQEELAYRCGFDFGYLSGIECGKENPSLKLLNAIAINLNIDLKNLFDFSNQYFKSTDLYFSKPFTYLLLGQRIRYFRHQQGLTQLQFAQYSELNRTYISELEAGKRNPTLAVIHKVVTTLKIDIRELFNL